MINFNFNHLKTENICVFIFMPTLMGVNEKVDFGGKYSFPQTCQLIITFISYSNTLSHSSSNCFTELQQVRKTASSLYPEGALQSTFYSKMWVQFSGRSSRGQQRRLYFTPARNNKTKQKHGTMAFGFDIGAKPNGQHEDIIVIITALLFTRP